MKHVALSVIALSVFIAVLLIWWSFDRDMKFAAARVAKASMLIPTRCGPIEYQEKGAGSPMLMIHGSGGGYDQGMAFAGALVHPGIRVIAMSRFGYLRTPMPADASPAAQADAHVCLLDALGIKQTAVLGASAGAPSAMQLAIRHPTRVGALVLVAPIAYKPSTIANSAQPLSSLKEWMLMRLVGSDFLFWTALHIARDQVIRYALATPPELLTTGSPQERERVNVMLNDILPVSARAQGLRSDSVLARSLLPYSLKSIHAPTLIFSARDDGFGTYANAQYTASQIAGAKFVNFEKGGHVLVGHGDEVRAEILKLLSSSQRE
jgi:2-hydroxy-6-oxonona-2,4-dienedioate hydrolase